MTGKPEVAVWRDAIRESDLPSTAKLVALVLSTYMNGSTLIAWPSRSTIAAGCSLSDRAVDKAIGKLEEAGMLDVLHTLGGNPASRSAGSTNTYRGTLSGANVVRPSGANVRRSGANERPLRGERGSPESAESARRATNAATAGAASSVVTVLDWCLGTCGIQHPEDLLKAHNGWCESCAPAITVASFSAAAAAAAATAGTA